MANSNKCIYLLLILFIGIFIFFYNGTSIAASPTAPETAKNSSENTDLAPLFWTVLFVGGSIAVTLSYVSWRKYKGEAKKETKKDKTVD